MAEFGTGNFQIPPEPLPQPEPSGSFIDFPLPNGDIEPLEIPPERFPLESNPPRNFNFDDFEPDRGTFALNDRGAAKLDEEALIRGILDELARERARNGVAGSAPASPSAPAAGENNDTAGTTPDAPDISPLVFEDEDFIGGAPERPPRLRRVAELGAFAISLLPTLRLPRRAPRPASNAEAQARKDAASAQRFQTRLDLLLVGDKQVPDVAALIQDAQAPRPVTLTERLLARRFPSYIRFRNAIREVNVELKASVVQAATAVLPAELRAAARERYLRSAANRIALIDQLDRLVRPADPTSDANADPAPESTPAPTPEPVRPPLPPRVRGEAVRQAPEAAAVAEAGRRLIMRRLERTPLKAIVETVLGDPARGERMRATMQKAARTVLTLAGVERQRPLQPWERAYLATVAPLTVVNPYVLASGKEAPATTLACMDAHYDRLIADSRERLPDGSFVRTLVVGFGEHGTIALGELFRLRPDLFDDPGIGPDGRPGPQGIAVVDRSMRPSSTFGYPGGRAFLMNSGAPIGDNWFALPDVAYSDEYTVRAYGGMFRGYPSERPFGVNRYRPLSINRGVDWMVPVEAYVSSKYPDNQQKYLSTAVQGSLLCPNFLGGSKLVGTFVNVDPTVEGEIGVILREIDADGNTSERILYTDNLFVATGKNKARTAFRQNVAFDMVLSLQERKPGLPYYTQTLEAFRYLADETQDGPIEHGGVFILTGDGNSVDTMLEALGRQVQLGNIDISKIEKIYVVGPNATTKVACRPRYQAIRDLFGRTGRPNVVELIDDRLEGISPIFDQDGNATLRVTNRFAEPLRDPLTGEEVRADHVIDNIGFRLDVEEALRGLIEEDGFFNLEEALEDVVLPGTNIAVGQRLARRRNVTFIGTASQPGFTPERLAELPPQSAEVLQLVGPENAVALGFVGGNTQATVFLTARQSMILPDLNPEAVGRTEPQAEVLPTNIMIPRGKGLQVGMPLDRDGLPKLRRSAPLDSSTLTPLMLAAMPEHILDTPITKQYTVRVRMTDDGYTMSAMQSTPQAVMEVVGSTLANSHFRAYAEAAAATRLGNNRELEITVGYENGRLVMGEKTYAQAF